MCWSMRVGATVTCNLLTRLYGDVSDLMYKLLLCCWVSQPVGNENVHDNVPWFENVNRKEAEGILRERPDGEFVIRPSSKPDNVCSLSVCQDREVYHINVRRRSDGFLALGRSKPNENCFASVNDIVDCYVHEKLLINSDGRKVNTMLVVDSLLRNVTTASVE